MAALNSDDNEEAWDDSVKKCKNGIIHHTGYIEVSNDQVKERIKEKIRSSGLGQMYRDTFPTRLNEELTLIKKRSTSPELLFEELSFEKYFRFHYDRYQEAYHKFEERAEKAQEFFDQQLEPAADEVLRKMEGVVRVQRKRTSQREHGTGTGVVVRLHLSGSIYDSRIVNCVPDQPLLAQVRLEEKYDFAILTNNHVIANEEEAEGAQIIFFYNEATSHTSPGPAPLGVVTKTIQSVGPFERTFIKWSPPVSSGQPATNENMDFSILRFDAGEDADFIKKLRYCCFYLNEFLENDQPNQPFMSLTHTIPLIAIGHPHGSNKRISFGTVNEAEREQMCTETDRCDVSYDLTTCKGSSGCPVLAVLINSKGYLKIAFQFLHFRTGRGIDLLKIHKACMTEDFSSEFPIFNHMVNSHEMLCYNPDKSIPIWWDEDDRLKWKNKNAWILGIK